MKIPLIIWVGVWANLVPVAAALSRPSHLRGPRLGVAISIAIGFLAGIAAWVWSHFLDRGNNLFISYFSLLLHSTAMLWAVAEWQVIPILRTAVRFCIPLQVVFWFVNVLFLEDLANFSLYAWPVHGALILATALLALVTRAGASEEPIITQDWFWILSGIAVMYVTRSTVSILQNVAITAGNYGLADIAQRFKASVDIVAFLAITWGFLWPSQPAYSGASSSPAPSR